jgi:hypothetical protein
MPSYAFQHLYPPRAKNWWQWVFQVSAQNCKDVYVCGSCHIAVLLLDQSTHSKNKESKGTCCDGSKNYAKPRVVVAFPPKAKGFFFVNFSNLGKTFSGFMNKLNSTEFFLANLVLIIFFKFIFFLFFVFSFC